MAVGVPVCSCCLWSPRRAFPERRPVVSGVDEFHLEEGQEGGTLCLLGGAMPLDSGTEGYPVSWLELALTLVQ